MRLIYSHVYSYENKYNPIDGNALNNLKKTKKKKQKKTNLQFFMRLFSQYSRKIIKIKERPLKHLLLLMLIN